MSSAISKRSGNIVFLRRHLAHWKNVDRVGFVQKFGNIDPTKVTAVIGCALVIACDTHDHPVASKNALKARLRRVNVFCKILRDFYREDSVGFQQKYGIAVKPSPIIAIACALDYCAHLSR